MTDDLCSKTPKSTNCGGAGTLPAARIANVRRECLQLEAALQGKAVRLVRIAAEYAGKRDSDGTDEERLIELDQLTPQELFSRAWQDSYGSEVDEQTLKDFAVLLQEVQQEGEQP